MNYSRIVQRQPPIFRRDPCAAGILSQMGWSDTALRSSCWRGVTRPARLDDIQKRSNARFNPGMRGMRVDLQEAERAALQLVPQPVMADRIPLPKS